MKAPHPPRRPLRAANRLERGATYQARTRTGTTVGEYLGMETPYGDRAILLRHRSGTDSIPLDEILSIRPKAA